jgi:surface polysaccharide O-acyltransferase-like enzyme
MGGQSLLIYLIHIEILNFIVLLNATFWNIQIQHAIVVLLGTFLLTWLSFSISTMIQQHRLSRKFFLLKV